MPPTTTAAEAARLTRQALDIAADQPIDHVMHTAEKAGVPVVVANIDLPDARHDAYSLWVGEFQEQPLITALPVDSWERTRWSIAHEIGHLVLHRGRSGEDVEEEANAFANEFLLPEARLRAEWPANVTLTTLMPLKRRWRMSLSALIMHGRSHGLLSRERAEGLFKQLSARRDMLTGVTWKMQEPGFDENLPERPRLLAVMTERGLERPASAALYSQISDCWAQDLMEKIVAGQREAPRVAAAKTRESRALGAEVSDNVIALRRRA